MEATEEETHVLAGVAAGLLDVAGDEAPPGVPDLQGEDGAGTAGGEPPVLYLFPTHHTPADPVEKALSGPATKLPPALATTML